MKLGLPTSNFNLLNFKTMLGIESAGVYWAYIGSALSAVACIIYGIINWNKGQIDENEQKKSKQWEEQDKAITDTL